MAGSLPGNIRSACFDSDGLRLKDTRIVEDGKAVAYYCDGGKILPVTGISITGSLKQVLSSIRLSCSSAVYDGYCGPEKAILQDMKIF